MSADGLDLDAVSERIERAEENYSPVPTVGLTTQDARALIAAVRERDALVDGLRVLVRGAWWTGELHRDLLTDLLDRTTGTDDGNS